MIKKNEDFSYVFEVKNLPVPQTFLFPQYLYAIFPAKHL